MTRRFTDTDGLCLPFVIETTPEDDESLPGLIMRASWRNRMGINQVPLRAAGIELTRVSRVGLLDTALVEPIHKVLGCDRFEIASRMYSYGIDPIRKFEKVLWNGDYLRRSDLVTKERRVSAELATKQQHHCASWMIKLLPFCRKTFALLVSSCNNCGRLLTWQPAVDVFSCHSCRKSVGVTDAPRLARELRADYRLFASLFDEPNTAAFLKALSCNLQLFHLSRLELIELIFILGKVVTPEAKKHQRRNPDMIEPGLLTSVMVRGTRLLRRWPEVLRDTVGTITNHAAAAHAIDTIKRYAAGVDEPTIVNLSPFDTQFQKYSTGAVLRRFLFWQ